MKTPTQPYSLDWKLRERERAEREREDRRREQDQAEATIKDLRDRLDRAEGRIAALLPRRQLQAQANGFMRLGKRLRVSAQKYWIRIQQDWKRNQRDALSETRGKDWRRA